MYPSITNHIGFARTTSVRKLTKLMGAMLAASAVLTACQEPTQPSLPMDDPQFVIFPQYVASIKNISGSVVESVTSPNRTTTGTVDYDPTTADSVIWSGEFHPATRSVDGDTTITVSLIEWSYTDQFGGPQKCFTNTCQFPGGSKNIRLKYKMQIVTPVEIGDIAGNSHISEQGTYTWSVSPSGGDAAASFSYIWRLSEDGGTSWTNVGQNASYSRTFNTTTYSNFILRAIATNSGQADSTTKAVTVANPLYAPVSASIQGPSNAYCVEGGASCTISSEGSYTWTGNASGGSGTYTYEWRIFFYDHQYWSGTMTGQTMTMDVSAPDGDFEVHLTVKSGTQATSTSQLVCNFIYPNDISCT